MLRLAPRAEAGVGCGDLFGKPWTPPRCLPATKDQLRVSVVDSSWLIFLVRLYFITFQIYRWSDFLFQDEE